MGNRRMGQARLESLLENLKREIKWGDGTSIYGAKKVVETIDAAKTLGEGDSGKVFIIDADSGAYDITLPANTIAGWHATFIMTDVHGSNDIDILSATADTIQGSIIDIGSAGTLVAARDKLTFVGGTSVVGDRVDVLIDGSSVNVLAYSGADGGITTTG